MIHHLHQLARWGYEGLLAAALGFGALAVPVLLLWMTSPSPDSGAGGALRVAADLWLLAHGTELVRADTLSSVPAPIGLTPLLLSALPCWLLYRAVRAVCVPVAGSVDADDPDGTYGTYDAPGVAVGITVGYLVAGFAVVLFAAGGPISARSGSAALHLPLFALAVTTTSRWALCGWPPSVFPVLRRVRRGRRRRPEHLAPVLRRRRAPAAVRVAVAGTAALCGGGVLLATGWLVLRAGSAPPAFGVAEVSDSWSGRTATLLLGLALAPNVAVWGVAYGLGPGFALGVGSVVAPFGVTGDPRLPPFPLLVVPPMETAHAGAPWTWALTAVVPAAGALVTSWCAARVAVPVRGQRTTATGWWGTAVTTLLAAGGAGAGLGLLAALAGGPLGTAALAELGPDPWRTALAAAGWTAALGLPAALVLRAWRLSRPRWAWAAMIAVGGKLRRAAWRTACAVVGVWVPARTRRAHRRAPRAAAAAAEMDDWHLTEARRTRWAAMKEASGGLMPDLPRPDAVTPGVAGSSGVERGRSPHP